MWEMPRDISIVMMVYKYDRVMIEHVQRAFFPGRSYISCYLRVAELIRSGYLSAQQLHPTTPRGSGKLLLGLGAQGKRLVARQLKKPVNTLPRLLPFRSGDKGQHHSATCHFRIGLEHACAARGDVEVIDWITERQLQQQKLNPRPDGIFTLSWEGKGIQDYRLEIDMGTHERWYMLDNFTQYLKLQERSPVLYVVLTDKRQRYLLEWARAVATREHLDPGFLWVAVTPVNPLDYVWSIPNSDVPVSLLGGPHA